MVEHTSYPDEPGGTWIADDFRRYGWGVRMFYFPTSNHYNFGVTGCFWIVPGTDGDDPQTRITNWGILTVERKPCQT